MSFYTQAIIFNLIFSPERLARIEFERQPPSTVRKSNFFSFVVALYDTQDNLVTVETAVFTDFIKQVSLVSRNICTFHKVFLALRICCCFRGCFIAGRPEELQWASLSAWTFIQHRSVFSIILQSD